MTLPFNTHNFPKPFKIYSDRHFQTWPSWHIVYEWEDEISKRLNIPISSTPVIHGKLTRNLSSIFRKIIHNDLTANYSRENKDIYHLYFEMYPKNFNSFSNQKNVIPVIIDFWHQNLINDINKYYKNCPFILVSSLEVLNYLKRSNCPLNLVHFPLSLPDKYRLEPDQTFSKPYDVVLAGRTNPVLWQNLKKYESIHPKIEYLYQEQKNGELYYRSNKNGLIGKFHSRQEYINLLRSAKISLYATPGIDGGEKRTGGFNPITPRFLELLSSGCHIIARYPKNEESEFYELDTICPSADSYEDFSKQMDCALNSYELPIKRNSDYLQNHYTSIRANILNKIINKN